MLCDSLFLLLLRPRHHSPSPPSSHLCAFQTQTENKVRRRRCLCVVPSRSLPVTLGANLLWHSQCLRLHSKHTTPLCQLRQQVRAGSCSVAHAWQAGLSHITHDASRLAQGGGRESLECLSLDGRHLWVIAVTCDVTGAPCIEEIPCSQAAAASTCQSISTEIMIVNLTMYWIL